MPDVNEDLSPWSSPKAVSWFATLLERSGFITQVEDTLHLDDTHLELAHGRMLLALLIMLGRPGIWPEDKQRVLQRAASRINKLANQAEPTNMNVDGRRKHKPMTLAEHKRNSASKVAIQSELELLRRRAGMSNRRSRLPAPQTWKRFWSGTDQDPPAALAPWNDENAIRFLDTMDSWFQLCKLVQTTLKQDPRKYPHQIRAACALIILVCRQNIWPGDRVNIQSIEEITGLARRQLAQVKQQFSIKSRINPELKGRPKFRKLLDSLDQEARILENRMADEPVDFPDEPPLSWGTFWCEHGSLEKN